MAIGIFVVLSGEDFNESQNAAIDGKVATKGRIPSADEIKQLLIK